MTPVDSEGAVASSVLQMLPEKKVIWLDHICFCLNTSNFTFNSASARVRLSKVEPYLVEMLGALLSAWLAHAEPTHYAHTRTANYFLKMLQCKVLIAKLPL